eukprot:jgi/Galph1/5370/GphlegSOOS_G4092.1
MKCLTFLGLQLPLAVICFIGHFVFFHVGCVSLSLCDYLNLLQKYKMHKLGDESYFQLLPRVLFNQLFLLLPSMLMAQYLGLGFCTSEAVFHPLVYVLLALWMALGHDVLFYLGHRFLLHSKWGFMRLGHDLHHSTKASIAISSMYMGTLDYILEIVLPYLIPLCLIRSDMFFDALAPCLGAVGGLYEHSGYNFFPVFETLSTFAHTMHHVRYNCSYSDGVGSTNLMDNALHTTYYHYGYKTIPKTRQKLVTLEKSGK